MTDWVGRRLPRRDAAPKAQGAAAYVADIAVPGMLAAAVLRSPHPHARLTRVDLSAALRVPGVVAVLSRDDLLGGRGWQTYFGPVLADESIVAVDRVRHVGDPVAAVAAVDQETACLALEAAVVEYEPLPAVTDLEQALAPGAPLVHDGEVRFPPGVFEDIRTQIRPVPGTNIFNHVELQRGDPERAFREAAVVVEDVYTSGHLQHCPIEPQGVIAVPSRGPGLHLIAPTQTPYIIRRMMGELFGIPLSRVRVTVPYIGGGFGSKAYPQLEPIVCALALKAGRPVRLVIPHDDCFVTINNPATRLRVRSGATADGRIAARSCEAYWDFGAYADVGPRMARNSGFAAVGPYRIPNVRIDSYGVYTNKPNCGGFRGYGITEMACGYEAHMDHLAQELGLDPLELRRRNLLGDGDEYVTGERLSQPAFREVVERAAELIGWEGPEVEVDRNPWGERVARAKGFGVIIKPTVTPSASSAAVRVNEDGSVTALVSDTEMGQGSETIMAQIAADALSVPLDQVVAAEVDTAVTPYDQCTTSSRSTFHMGQALVRAAADARCQLLDLAAGELEADPRDLELRDGCVAVVGTPRRISLQDLMRTPAGRLRGTVVGHGEFDVRRELKVPYPDGQRTPTSAFWCCGAGAAEVELNRDTGEVRVLRCAAVADVGRAINPLTVEQQQHGSSMAAIGHVLLEAVRFQEGQPLNGGLLSYRIPGFAELPSDLQARFVEHAHKAGPFGAKGGGETCVPAVAAALVNALGRAAGRPVRDLPARPEELVRASS